MNGPNKLTEAYLPDKGARKEKIVVGLTGGIDSRVAAYLLKIQRYDLIGVTVVNSWEDFPADSSNVLSCALNDKKLEDIQSFCHQLGIPHFTVRIPREFRDSVIEEWVAKKIEGKYPDQCWSCHELRMKFLHAKMQELGAKTFATGHFAKVFRQDQEGISYVQTSNDEVHDQSALLSRLPQAILRDVMLPLSDLQKKEVLKLAENFGLEVPAAKLSMFHCLPDNEDTHAWLMKQVPERFRKEGILVGGEEERLGDHDGVIRYSSGEVVLSTAKREDLFFTGYEAGEKKIVLRPESWFLRQKIMLRNCRIPEETPWSVPFRGVLMKGGKASEGWFTPKSIASCMVELDAPMELIEGESVHAVRKKGKNSRVLLSGEVSYIVEEVKVEDDQNVQIDYGREF